MTAPGSADKLGAGAPEKDLRELDWETLKAAVEIIEDWELQGESATALAEKLFRLFKRVTRLGS